LDQLEKANFLSSKELDRALCGVSAKSSPSYIAKKEKKAIEMTLVEKKLNKPKTYCEKRNSSNYPSVKFYDKINKTFS